MNFQLAFISLLFAVVRVAYTLNVTVLHTNDVHCRFMSFNSQNRPCSQKDVEKNKCWGGAARRMTAIRNIRNEQKNVLLLDGGDQYQGTVWFTALKWEPIAVYMNIMNYQAMAFGNHEFDNGLQGLVPFIKNVSVPFVGSNIDTEGSILDNTYHKTLELDVEGQKIGIVGYVTPDTVDISRPGDTIHFNDEVVSLKKAVAELNAKGINKIIALGHSGISMDRKICKEVKGIDLVIGGHTNTFLYSGKPPSDEVPAGTYPEVYTDTGSNCLVVQDYAYGKYLGFLQVDFDQSGVISKWNGNPILLDNKFEEDAQISQALNPYAVRLEAIEKTIVGMTAVPLNTMLFTCKQHECAMGNLVADAFVYQYLKLKWFGNGHNITGWSPAAIAFMNSGGLREFSIGAMSNLTLGDLHTILPFSDTVQMIHIEGRYIREALEHSVEDFYEDDTHGKFLQVSGIKVVYDLNKPNNQRIRSLLVRCAECEVPTYEPLDDKKVYAVISNNYVLEGGNGYYMLSKNIIKSDQSDILDIDVVADYIKRFQPTFPSIEGRIGFVNEDSFKDYCKNSAPTSHSLFSCFLMLCFTIVRLF